MVRLPEKNPDDHAQGDAVGASPASLPNLTDLSQEVKELVRLVTSTDISELHVESGPVRIVIKRGAAGAPLGHAPAHSVVPAGAIYTPPPTLVTPDISNVVNMIGQSPAHGDGVTLAEGEQLVVAPMVGTFYAAPAPGSEPYVSEGDLVEPGQIVGIIEAMKMMNEIESEVAGKIARILVKNAQPVEYGQPLMVVSSV